MDADVVAGTGMCKDGVGTGAGVVSGAGTSIVSGAGTGIGASGVTELVITGDKMS